MSKIRILHPDWKAWIIENLKAGCSEEILVEEMVKKNFDPAFATSAVAKEAAELGIAATVTADDPIGLNGKPKKPNMLKAVWSLFQSNLKDARRKEGLAPAEDGYVYEEPRFNHRGHFIQTNDKVVRIVARAYRPVVAVVEGVLSDEECDILVEMARGRLKPSKVVNPLTGDSELSTARTSSNAHFRFNEDEFISRIERRIAEVMNVPMEHGEPLQVLNYQIGAEYKAHHDYFDRAGEKAHTMRGGHRVSTLVIYLNEVDEGGGTSFPDAGITVHPKKGSAVYFEYHNSLGQLDPMSLHSGDPVVTGEKWVATKWVRERKFY